MNNFIKKLLSECKSDIKDRTIQYRALKNKYQSINNKQKGIIKCPTRDN